MSQQIIESITQAQLKTDVPQMFIGDMISVHFRIVEGDKERTQVFTGVLMGRAGRGITEMITVRKIVEEVGVERVVPINSPLVSKFEVLRRGDSRRAKLYFLRERVGKSRRLRDRRRGMKHIANENLGTQSSTPKAAPAADAAKK
jgi:large subunit ribosomal protein L19